VDIINVTCCDTIEVVYFANFTEFALGRQNDIWKVTAFYASNIAQKFDMSQNITWSHT